MKSLFSEETSSSEETSDSDFDVKKPLAVDPNVTFRCAPQSLTSAETSGSIFFLDRVAKCPDDQPASSQNGLNEDDQSTVFMKAKSIEKSEIAHDSSVFVDSRINELLSKSQIGVGFEKDIDETLRLRVSRRNLWRKREIERERTKGNDWFNLPATEMTEERQQDLEIIQMRDALDTKTHYKKNDRFVLPKYFQVGTVIESKADFYSSRIPIKQRKQTIVDELIADAEFLTKQRKKFQEIRAREAIRKKGAFQHRTFPRKKRKVMRR